MGAAITAPTRQSGVLKSVKASKGSISQRAPDLTITPVGSASPVNHFNHPPPPPNAAQDIQGVTMGKGRGRAARPQIDQIAWWSAIAEDRKRNESVGSASGHRSSSRPRNDVGSLDKRGKKTIRSGSQGAASDNEDKAPQSLQEE
jgi:hypothetical protein